MLPGLAGRNFPSAQFTTWCDLIGREKPVTLPRDCLFIGFIMDSH